MFVSFANQQVNDYPCDSNVVTKGGSSKKKKGEEGGKKEWREEGGKKERREEGGKKKNQVKPGSRQSHQKVYRNMGFAESSNSITDITQAGQQKQLQSISHKQPSLHFSPPHPYHPPPLMRVAIAPTLHSPYHHPHHPHYMSSKYPHPKELKLVKTTNF